MFSVSTEVGSKLAFKTTVSLVKHVKWKLQASSAREGSMRPRPLPVLWAFPSPEALISNPELGLG